MSWEGIWLKEVVEKGSFNTGRGEKQLVTKDPKYWNREGNSSNIHLKRNFVVSI